MNRIDPDDEEEEEEGAEGEGASGEKRSRGAPGAGQQQANNTLAAGAGGAAVSYNQPHQQAYLRQQLAQQQAAYSGGQMQQQQQPSPYKSNRPKRSTAPVDYGQQQYQNSGGEGMVLDPITGMMVPGSGGGEQDDIIFEGQSGATSAPGLASSSSNSNCTTKVCVCSEKAHYSLFPSLHGGGGEESSNN